MQPIALVEQLSDRTTEDTVQPPAQFQVSYLNHLYFTNLLAFLMASLLQDEPVYATVRKNRTSDTMSSSSQRTSSSGGTSQKATSFAKKSSKKSPQNVGTYDSRYVIGKTYTSTESLPVPVYGPLSEFHVNTASTNQSRAGAQAASASVAAERSKSLHNLATTESHDQNLTRDLSKSSANISTKSSSSVKRKKQTSAEQVPITVDDVIRAADASDPYDLDREAEGRSESESEDGDYSTIEVYKPVSRAAAVQDLSADTPKLDASKKSQQDAQTSDARA